MRKAATVVVADGLSPLEFLLAVMRDEKRDIEMRMRAAIGAAPYCHQKLATIEHTGEITTNVVHAEPLTAQEWVKRHAAEVILDDDDERVPIN